MTMLLALALPGCAAYTVGGGHGNSGVVRGTVSAAPQAEAAATVETSPRDAVVYLDAAEAGELGRAPTPVTLMVRVGRTFEPRVTVVCVGSRVRFENHDILYHSVFSVSPTKRFDTGLFGGDHAKIVVFSQPGVVELHCGIDDAVGYVLVVPHALFARPDASGAFAIGPLPRGTWTLKAWHPVWGNASTTVEVGAVTPTVALRFAGNQPRTSALP
jgi:plastocyanin